MADNDEIDADDPRDAEPPRGQTSLLTMLLIVFNILAILGFAVLLYMDIGKRQEWTAAVFLRDLANVGVATDIDTTTTNPEAAVQPKFNLDPPLLKDAYAQRGGRMTERFVEVNESFKVNIRHADLDERILARYFAEAGVPGPVATLKEEIDRLQNELPGQIETVARGVVESANAKKADKRALLRKILFPICTEGRQVVNLDKKINDTPDAKLDEFLQEAAQRRLYFDILQPLEIYRPSELLQTPDPDKVVGVPKFKKEQVDVARAAELDVVKLDDLRKHFAKRCGDVMAAFDWNNPAIQRDSAEKRRCAAFLLVDVSQVEIPGAERIAQKQPAKEEPKAKEGEPVEQPPVQPQRKRLERPLAFPEREHRAEVVCGLRDFTQACEDFTIVTDIIDKQMRLAIDLDIGNARLPLPVRMFSPKLLATELVGVMKQMKLPITDDDGLRKAVEDRLKGMQGKIDSSEVLARELKSVLDTQAITIAEPKAFESMVDGVYTANALGFMGHYQLAVQRIQDLAKVVEQREDEWARLKKTDAELAKQLQVRAGHEKEVFGKLLDARAKTHTLRQDLQFFQQQLFLAQVNIAGAQWYNLYLHDRLAEIEKQKLKSKGAPRQ